MPSCSRPSWAWERGAPGPAAAQAPPDEAWRTLETAHFRITFPERLTALAGRAGRVAEQAHEALTAGFRAGPKGTIDIVLTDHVDVSNGFARYSPSNRIVLYARPPADHPALAYFDDWLEQLVVHELAHVFHLDDGGAFGGFFRALLGRQPWPGSILTFPGANVPGWVVEGLATWYESALTAGGRVHGTYHEMALRTAALEGRFESIGQAGGNSPQWPGGGRRYVYGSLFFEHLLDKHGHGRMADFVEDVVRNARLPSRVLDDVSLTDEWGAWTDEMRTRAGRLDADLARFGPITEPEALTRGARQGLHPAVSPDGGALVYARSDGRSDPRLAAMPPAGGDASTLARTNHLTGFDFLPGGGIVFAQREYTDRYRRYSDLHVLTPEGSVRRVTAGARVTAPAADPEGGGAVAVADGGGTNGLVRVDLRNGGIEPIVAPAADIYWAWPAVSPDGRWNRGEPLDRGPARRGHPRPGRAGGPRGDARPGPRHGPRLERGRTPPRLVVRPHRHPERPRGRGRRPNRRRRSPAPAHQRAHGGGVPERRPRRRLALFLGVPRRRLGDRAGPVRPGWRSARPRAGRALRRPRPRDRGCRDGGRRDPGQRDPGQRDPGQRDPGQRDPGQRDPGQRDPG